jgi:hypothetical protein
MVPIPFTVLLSSEGRNKVMFKKLLIVAALSTSIIAAPTNATTLVNGAGPTVAGGCVYHPTLCYFSAQPDFVRFWNRFSRFF